MAGFLRIQREKSHFKSYYIFHPWTLRGLSIPYAAEEYVVLLKLFMRSVMTTEIIERDTMRLINDQRHQIKGFRHASHNFTHPPLHPQH